jgi:hypothetical protein
MKIEMTLSYPALAALLGVTERTIRQWCFADRNKTTYWIIGNVKQGFKLADVWDFVNRNRKYRDRVLAWAFAPDTILEPYI